MMKASKYGTDSIKYLEYLKIQQIFIKSKYIKRMDIKKRAS